MEYMLLFTESAEHFAQRNDPEHAPAYWGAWMAYCDALAASGIMVSGAGLQSPDAATTVHVRDGKRQVHDGPYAESKEMLGGFFVSTLRISMPRLNGRRGRHRQAMSMRDVPRGLARERMCLCRIRTPRFGTAI